MDVEDVRLDAYPGIAPGHVAGVAPVCGDPSTVEQAQFGQQECSGAHTGDPSGMPGEDCRGLEQAGVVRANGYTDMQGYLVSRPVPAGAVAALIARLNTEAAEGRHD